MYAVIIVIIMINPLLRPPPLLLLLLFQGVELCDQLSARYGGVPTNGEELSHARRDKYLMGET